MKTSLDELSLLKDEWQRLQPLKPEDNRRLWRKLRLEWNYHSNHIEGNTLTYGETELLLLHDRTTGDHSHREYVEMKAHDVGIEHMLKLAADPVRILTESDIRDFNKIILKEPFWKPAETIDGQPTRIQVIPGAYKTNPNNVRTATGEMFFYASVEDTPPRMQALSDWLKRELESPTLHPVELAAKLHHDFALIHPFGDGNGRVARLLANYVLQRFGYLPIIVPTGDKVRYLTALRLADAGDLSAFTEYFAYRAVWSLHVGIKAAKGESIDEPSDVEKQVQIFIREQQARKNDEAAPTREIIQNLLEVSIIPLLEKAETKFAQLAPLFRKMDVRTSIQRSGIVSGEKISYRDVRLTGPGDSVMISFMFYSYQGESLTPFNFETTIELHFPSSHYTLMHSREIMVTNPYSKMILADEAETITAMMLSKTFERIRARAKRES